MHFNGTEAQPANQPDLPSAGRLLATLAVLPTLAHHMLAYEKLYEQFQLTPNQRENLRSVTDSPFREAPKLDRFIVETVIVEGGERRIISKEEQSAKLV